MEAEQPKMIVMSFNEYCNLHNVNSNTIQSPLLPPLKKCSPISYISDTHMDNMATTLDTQLPQPIDINTLRHTYSGASINGFPSIPSIPSIDFIPSIQSISLSLSLSIDSIPSINEDEITKINNK
eukprot:97241_1